MLTVGQQRAHCISLNECKLCDWHSSTALRIKCTNCNRAVCKKQTRKFWTSACTSIKIIASLSGELEALMKYSIIHNRSERKPYRSWLWISCCTPTTATHLRLYSMQRDFSRRWHRFMRIICCAQFHPLICQIKSVGNIQGFNVQLIAPLTRIESMQKSLRLQICSAGNPKN